MAILETNNDITERKRKEAELLHKTALLDELFEGSPDAVVLMDLEARVLRISREFAALFGYAAEEAAGTPGCRSDRARGRARRLARRVCASRVGRAVRLSRRAPAQGWHAHPCVDQACADRSRGES